MLLDVFVKRPASHGRQTAPTLGRYSPGWQAWQDALPANDIIPLSHGVHSKLLENLANLPLAQSMHLTPVSFKNLPGWHSSQDEAPAAA